MKERGEFIKALNGYYYHLLNRWENGSEYLTKNPDDEKSLKVYKRMTQELKLLQAVKNFYNG